MPINPIQFIGQIRGQYDHTTVTIKVGNVPVQHLISEVSDAGGATIENAELQYALGSGEAFAMNPGTIKAKTISISGWAETVPQLESVITKLGGGTLFGALFPFSITFGLKASQMGLSAISAPSIVYSWGTVRVIESGLSIPKGVSTGSLVMQPINSGTITGKKLYK
jgi:hypothetical protein